MRNLTVQEWRGNSGFDVNDESGKTLGSAQMVYFADTEGTCYCIYELEGKELHGEDTQYAKTKAGAAMAIVNALLINEVTLVWKQ